MPYQIRKLPNQNKYRVTNKETGRVSAFSTTKKKAEGQVKLLMMRDNQKKGGKIKKKKTKK